MDKHAIDFIGQYVKETMMRSGNAVSSHSGLISFETVRKKRRINLLPLIARKRNLIGVRSAALNLFTILVCNLVHAY